MTTNRLRLRMMHIYLTYVYQNSKHEVEYENSKYERHKYITLQWYRIKILHNERSCVSNHQPHGSLLNRLFRRKSKKTSKLRITGLYVGNSPGTGEFPAQMASNAENVSIWWRHHGLILKQNKPHSIPVSGIIIPVTAIASLMHNKYQSPFLYTSGV